jgi:hypothetical protein
VRKLSRNRAVTAALVLGRLAAAPARAYEKPPLLDTVAREYSLVCEGAPWNPPLP